MAKRMRNKLFYCNGLIQDLNTIRMAECKFRVMVSNDDHCTVSVAPDDETLPIQYCVDFSKILKELEG